MKSLAGSKKLECRGEADKVPGAPCGLIVLGFVGGHSLLQPPIIDNPEQESSRQVKETTPRPCSLPRRSVLPGLAGESRLAPAPAVLHGEGICQSYLSCCQSLSVGDSFKVRGNLKTRLKSLILTEFIPHTSTQRLFRQTWD